MTVVRGPSGGTVELRDEVGEPGGRFAARVISGTGESAPPYALPMKSRLATHPGRYAEDDSTITITIKM